ncbi:uncharacterized protein PHALS_08430 [Plasmopara halstedii]|uniref:RXLR phytopathogen effector protein WY-domain domain-containing protein n=1 Tax=Plasmopara halstedii TaxID=4781 RepID=A0A0P1AD39_PLAHL|nr:uncharacterized protein PHALS_08430 [Plasmopara halstedii]CEG38350.1 hypothetical protein PHALS_08430 [Plasmopara halstedii]|eukprot:XP_024574719.1 hypothetical protein PHALS_08430 [Plasmopara halstedii]
MASCISESIIQFPDLLNMREYALFAICHIGVGVCIAFNSSGVGYEVPRTPSPEYHGGPANTSHVNSRQASKRYVVSGNDKSNFSATNEEERWPWYEFLNFWSWRPKRSFEKIDVEKRVAGTEEFVTWLDRLKLYCDDGGRLSYNDFFKLMEKGRSSEELGPLYYWLNEYSHVSDFARKRLTQLVSTGQDYKKILESFVRSGVSPKQLYVVLGIQTKTDAFGLFQFGTIFNRWFEFIILYRGVEDKKPAFGSEELFDFLVNELEEEMKKTQPLSSSPSLDNSRRIVVNFFREKQPDSHLKGITEDMIKYLTVNPVTEQMVFEAFSDVSPFDFFGILDLVNELRQLQSNIFLFLAWLKYVKVYCYSEKVNPRDIQMPNSFIVYSKVLIPMTSDAAVNELLLSEKFVVMLDDAKSPDIKKNTQELLETFKVPYIVKQWLLYSKNPADLIECLKHSPKFGDTLLMRVEPSIAIIPQVTNVRSATISDKIESSTTSSPQITIHEAKKTDIIKRDDTTLLVWLIVTSSIAKHPDFSDMQLFDALGLEQSTQEWVKLFLSIREISTFTTLVDRLLKHMFSDPRTSEEALKAAKFIPDQYSQFRSHQATETDKFVFLQ